MKIDYYPLSTWEKCNSELESHFGYDGKTVKVALFKGLHQALSEITQGLVHQYPHKNKAFYAKDQDPFFELPVKHLSMDGYNILPIEANILSAPESWVEGLGREVLFSLYSLDNPITGEIRDLSLFHRSLLAKKVISIQVNHQSFRRESIPQSLDRHEVRVYSLGPELALAIMGARVRFVSKVCSGEYFDGSLVQQAMASLEPLSENKEAVLSFEKQMQQFGASPLFAEEQLRLYDRAAIYWKDMDGFAFIHYLSKELGISLNVPGLENRFETTSLSRWRQLRAMSWLEDLGLSQEALRGLVFIDSLQLTPKLIGSIKKVREYILSLQNF